MNGLNKHLRQIHRAGAATPIGLLSRAVARNHRHFNKLMALYGSTGIFQFRLRRRIMQALELNTVAYEILGKMTAAALTDTD